MSASYTRKFLHLIKIWDIKNTYGDLFLNTRNEYSQKCLLKNVGHFVRKHFWKDILDSYHCMNWVLIHRILSIELGAKYKIKIFEYKLWNDWYTYLIVKNMIVAHKLKAITRTNEHDDLHIECDAIVFFSHPFSFVLVENYRLNVMKNKNKNIRILCPETTFILILL